MAQDSTAALAQLTGSEKQVAWAEKIRDEFIANTERVLASARPSAQPMVLALHEQMRRAIEAARLQTSAAWWVDTRSLPRYDLQIALAERTPVTVGLGTRRETTPSFGA